MPGSPKLKASAACAVAGPVAWTAACMMFLFTADLTKLASSTGELFRALYDPKVPFLLFCTLGLVGGLLGGGRWRALSSFVSGLAAALMTLVLFALGPEPVMATVFPMIAGPIMGVGYALGARAGRKVSKGAFAGLFAGMATTALVFVVFGLNPGYFCGSAVNIYLGGLVVSYISTFVFFAFYSGGAPRPPARKAPPPPPPPLPRRPETG